jgi:glycosyltransferase involved in cell wall biosynthesis
VRLAVITETPDRVGGVEAYLEAILPPLASRYTVAFWTARDEITGRGPLRLPPGVPAMTVDRSTADPVHQLRAWRPDVLFAHGLNDPALERQLLAIAPAVIVQHTYHGTCISSSKTMSWPAATQCERRFGPACLALYFPRQCGGSNPITMARLYRTQAVRLRSLIEAAAVVTLSSHMAEEMRRNGVPSDRVHVVPPFVALSDLARRPITGHGPVRLLYLGRLEPLKGVRDLLDALPQATRRIGRPLHLTVAGDGAVRAALEHQAASICAADPHVEIRFVGWQGDDASARLLVETDALVVPSLWPEPFGLVGLEAAAAGVPAIAFATGGIPEWLRDGETGTLAPAQGARVAQLADAIVRCVGEPEGLARLSAGARRGAASWTLERHLAGLANVFDRVRVSSVTTSVLRAVLSQDPC